MRGFLLKLSASLVILYLLFRQIPLAELSPYFIQMSTSKFLWAYGVQMIGIVLSIIRWQMIMNSLQFVAPKGFYFKQALIGIMFNQVLPTSIGGDAYKILVSTKLNQPKKNAVFGVLIDRFYGLSGLIVMSAFVMPSAYKLLPHEIFNLIAGFNILFFLGLGLLISIPALRLSFKHFSLKIISELAHAAISPINSLSDALIKIALAILPNLLTIYAFLLLAEAQNISTSFFDLLVVVPSLLILSMLPISLGGWGLREGGFVFLGSFIGLSHSESLAISLLFGCNVLLTSLPGLFIYWKQKKLI